MMRNVAGAVLIGLAVAGPVHAADFSGPTLGVAVTYTNAELDAARIQAGSKSAGSLRPSVSAGYDFHLTDHLVAGAEVSAAFGDKEICAAGSRGRYCATVKTDLSAVARLGYVVAPKVLLFGEGGYATVPARLVYTDALVPRRNSVKSGDLSGLRLGIGAEVALSKRTYARVTYRYTNYWCGIEQSQLLAGVGLRF